MVDSTNFDAFKNSHIGTRSEWKPLTKKELNKIIIDFKQKTPPLPPGTEWGPAPANANPTLPEAPKGAIPITSEEQKNEILQNATPKFNNINQGEIWYPLLRDSTNKTPEVIPYKPTDTIPQTGVHFFKPPMPPEEIIQNNTPNKKDDVNITRIKDQ